MVGSQWSVNEERVFWRTIVPQSPKATKQSARVSTWKECAAIMQLHMGENARRTYTKLMLFEHYFQNMQSGHQSPNAGRFVAEHRRELELEAGNAELPSVKKVTPADASFRGLARRSNPTSGEDTHLIAFREDYPLYDPPQVNTSGPSDATQRLKRKVVTEFLEDYQPAAKSICFEHPPLRQAQSAKAGALELPPDSAVTTDRSLEPCMSPTDGSSRDGVGTDSPASQVAPSSANTTVSEAGSAHAGDLAKVDDESVSPKTCVFP